MTAAPAPLNDDGHGFHDAMQEYRTRIGSDKLHRTLWKQHVDVMTKLRAQRPDPVKPFRKPLMSDVKYEPLPKAEVRKRDYLVIPPPPPSENPYQQPWRLRQGILERVARDFGVTPTDLRGKRRYRAFVWPRAIAAKLMADCGFSTPAIGRTLDRDHSTICHALSNVFPNAMRDEVCRAVYQSHAELRAEVKVANDG